MGAREAQFHFPTSPPTRLPSFLPAPTPPASHASAQGAGSPQRREPRSCLGSQALTGPTGPYPHAPICATHTCASHTCCTHMQGATSHLRGVMSRGEPRGGWTFRGPEPGAGACRDSRQLLRQAGEDTAFPKRFHLPGRPRRPPDAGRMRPSPL